MAVVQKLIEFCPDRPLQVPQLRDPDDTIILATALVAKAEVVVTGDLDLLTLQYFENIPIITPKEFLHLYSLER